MGKIRRLVVALFLLLLVASATLLPVAGEANKPVALNLSKVSTTSLLSQFSGLSAGTSVPSTPTQVVAAPKASVAAPAAPAASAPACSKTNVTTPSFVAITPSNPGVTQVTDQPTYYAVHGYTGDQIRGEIQQCSPVSTPQGDDFTADTMYALSWRVSYTTTAGGMCRVGSAAVGLHIVFVYPQWDSAPQDSAGLAASWQTFMQNLTTHENGHASLDSQYANQLLSDLQSLPASECNSIDQVVSNMGHHDLAALDAANDAYDASTDHGATQGAVLPQ